LRRTIASVPERNQIKPNSLNRQPWYKGAVWLLGASTESDTF
jgi:hypothetical protein